MLTPVSEALDPRHLANLVLNPSRLSYKVGLFVPVLQTNKLTLKKPGHNLNNRQTRAG